jgi:hypothetical protein
VIEDIRALTAQLAADPTSLVFLRLGEALRGRGQLEAAQGGMTGLSHYPHLPDAHDLYARILADRQDCANAFDEWDMVLRIAPSTSARTRALASPPGRRSENAIRHLQRPVGRPGG